MWLVPAWAPNLHPLIVHFPIALLAAAGAVDLADLLLRGREPVRNAATWLYVAGAATAVAAYFSGVEAGTDGGAHLCEHRAGRRPRGLGVPRNVAVRLLRLGAARDVLRRSAEPLAGRHFPPDRGRRPRLARPDRAPRESAGLRARSRRAGGRSRAVGGRGTGCRSRVGPRGRTGHRGRDGPRSEIGPRAGAGRDVGPGARAPVTGGAGRRQPPAGPSLQELAPQNANGVRAAARAPRTVGAGADPDPATGWRR